MKYICVKWSHSNLRDPVILYSELDDERMELRKVEVFHDGWFDFACSSESTGVTKLGLVPIPPLAEIAIDQQFEPKEITEKEFEEVWSKRCQ